MHKALLIAWMILMGTWAAPAYAQHYSMRAFGRKSGLESQAINVVYQDRRGFIWVGTEVGLYRFNGTAFDAMTPRNGFATSQFINAITEDSTGHMWVATQTGLHVGDGTQFMDVQVDGKPVIADVGRRLTALPDGRLLLIRHQQIWALTRTGSGAWAMAPLFDAAQLRQHPQLGKITAMQLTHGQLWLGCGSNVCAVHGNSITVHGPADGVPNDFWAGFRIDQGGTLWLQGTHHIVVRPAGAKHFQARDIPGADLDVLTDDVDMVEDAQHRLLIRTDRGMARWDGSHWQLFNAANGLPDIGITAVLFDRNGDLWLGTYGRGVYLWSGYGVVEGWGRTQGMRSALTWAIVGDGEGNIWFANDLSGDVLDRGATRLHPWPVAIEPPPRQNVSMPRAADGSIWIVTYEGRILRYDPATGKTALVARSPAFVKGSGFDRTGRLWLATVHGVFALDAGTSVVHGFADANLPTGVCSDVAEAADGTVWMACNAGMLRYAHGQWTRMRDGSGAPVGGYVAVAANPDGSLWLGGNQPGLFRANVLGDTLQMVRSGDRWTDKTIAYFVRHDQRGWLWVGGSAGVDVFNGKRWVHLSQDSGLLWDESDQNAFFAADDGSVWLGTAIGASHVLAPEALFKPLDRKVVLTEATRGDDPLHNEAVVDLNQRGPPLTFRFARLGKATGSAPDYRYRLLGGQAGWIETRTNEVDISALPAGDYRFEVQLIDDDQGTVAPSARFAFTVPPLWWNSWWARLGLFVLLTVLVLLAWRWRMRALMARNRQLDIVVHERTRELTLEKAELEKARAELYVYATFDELTGLLNRRAILDWLQNALEQPAADRGGIAVAMIDLDHFKRVNDTHGHQAGDCVLREVAQRLAKCSTANDKLGRYGGEELLLVMQSVDAGQALEHLHHLIAQTSSEPYFWADTEFNVTLSAGMAWVAGNAAVTSSAIISRTDDALYAAKREGRNRVVVAPRDRS